MGDSESTASWSTFFTWLKSRQLQGVDLVVSDSHGGLGNAVKSSFQGCTWQRCQTHFTRNVLDAAPKSLQEDIHVHLRSLLTAPDADTAKTLLSNMLQQFADKAAKAMNILEEGFEDATAVLVFPEKL